VRARTPLARMWATGPSSRRVTRCPVSYREPGHGRSINQGELVVDGITAVELELWLDLSVGAALGPPAATPG